jgi:hypothetical protein
VSARARKRRKAARREARGVALDVAAAGMLAQLEAARAAVKALPPLDPTCTFVMHPTDAAEMLDGWDRHTGERYMLAQVDIRTDARMPIGRVAHLDRDGQFLRISKVRA